MRQRRTKPQSRKAAPALKEEVVVQSATTIDVIPADPGYTLSYEIEENEDTQRLGYQAGICTRQVIAWAVVRGDEAGAQWTALEPMVWDAGAVLSFWRTSVCCALDQWLKPTLQFKGQPVESLARPRGVGAAASFQAAGYAGQALGQAVKPGAQ